MFEKKSLQDSLNILLAEVTGEVYCDAFTCRTSINFTLRYGHNNFIALYMSNIAATTFQHCFKENKA